MSNRLQRAKSVDLYHYLSSQGYHPVNENSRRAYYLSPKRNETHPSFQVDKIDNRWADWGDENGGGDIIDFLTWLDGCTTGQAIDKILGEDKLPQYHRPDPAIVLQKPIEIINVQEGVTNEALIEYMEQRRRLPIEVVNKYCKQVTFRFASSMWVQHFGVGLENDLGGFSIRSDWFKGNSKPMGISTTVFSQDVRISLFEGMCDFLTYVTLNAEPVETCVVLNSVVNIHMMTDHLRAYDEIKLFLDNDAAGDDKTEFLMAGGYPVSDMRHLYSDYNDYNDYLISNFDF